ncbi:MAG: type II toxin-antitoxin system HicA family toxin [Magnetococcales bacterium]|nr:type II toxin-antitoxin system HicA family toxin [Magnetococcales bacterium]
MGKNDKFILKARTNPSGLSFAEFENLLTISGWVFDRQSGSHRIWIAPDRTRLSIQNRKGMGKGYQVKQFLKIQEG